MSEDQTTKAFTGVDLENIRPTKKELVFDLVSEAGFDVSDWIASASRPNKIKANPKYCYEWSFVQPQQFIILNLWHEIMRLDGGRIIYVENFRANAEFNRRKGGKRQWVSRATKIDRAVAAAARDGLGVRVIVLDGNRRDYDNPKSESSEVTARQLDDMEWHISSYDEATGDCVIERGPGSARFIDQFDLSNIPEQYERSGKVYKRDPGVRKNVRRRANGYCELCGERGFKMPGGAIFLETHHVIPLSENGLDNEQNVVALCPNDHRRCHYSLDKVKIREELLEMINQFQSS